MPITPKTGSLFHAYSHSLAGSYAKSSVKTGCGIWIRCAAAIGGESTATSSSNITRTRLASRPELDPDEASKLSRRTVIGA